MLKPGAEEASDRSITTGHGCVLNLAYLLILGLMAPGGLWMMTGRGVFSWRIEFLFACILVGGGGFLFCWSLGWARYRNVLWSRPAWLIHPFTRTCLVFIFVTLVIAWPVGASQDSFVQVLGLFVAPAVGALTALLWLAIYLIVRPHRPPQ